MRHYAEVKKALTSKLDLDNALDDIIKERGGPPPNICKAFRRAKLMAMGRFR